MLRQYTVTLHRYEDLDAFYEDMETPGGDLYIPDRAIDVAKRRPLSRNTLYWLTADEASQVKADPRVLAVELSIEEQDIRIEPVWYQESNFYKGSFTSNPDLAGSDKNWGLLRLLSGSDIPRHGFDDIKRLTANVSATLDGIHVDVVIVDGHIRPTHAEFAANVDGSGGTRVQQLDWLAFASAIGKTLPSSGTAALPMSYDYASYYNTSFGDHGAMVAAIAAGNTQGWARKSHIYNISPYNESGMVAADDAMDYIKYWHQSVKTVNPDTGNKNPTVINLSWGLYRYINVLQITTIVYRGVTYSGPWTNTGNGTRTYQQLGLGFNGAKQYFRSSGDLNYYIKISEPVASWQADTDDLINAGVHVVIAAGNDGMVQDVASGPDYNNSISTISVPGGIYYNRKSGPASANAISVGSIDASSYAPGVDYYSNRGPAVELMAPGSGIVSAINRTTSVAGSVADSRGLNSDRIMVGHGTSLAAPQITGMLATLMSLPGHQNWLPAFAKSYLVGTAKTQQLVDYEAPYDLAGTPNRYSYYREYYITTTTTVGPTTTSTSSTTTSTSTSTTSTSTSTSTTSTTTAYYPPGQFITVPVICYPVLDSTAPNVVANVAWFSFTTVTTQTLVINTLSSVLTYDSQIALYDYNGEIIISNDDSGDNDLSYFEVELNPGTYFLAVGLFDSRFNQRFRAESNKQLPASGLCITVYDKAFPLTTTTSTSTTSTSTSTTSTSTSTSTTSTTTYAPYPVIGRPPPNFVLKRTWCDNFVLWGYYENQYQETYTGIIAFNSVDCGFRLPTTSTSTTSTTTTYLPPSTWDSTVNRLSILVNRAPVAKLPVLEPNLSWILARGQLPNGVSLLPTGVISGIPVITESELVFGQPAYVFNFGPVSNNNSVLNPEILYRQYSISVITNGLLIPNLFLPTNTVVSARTYTYTINSSYIPNPSTGRIWRLRWGLLPPNSTFSPLGLLSVVASTDIRPFQRSEFLPPGFIDTASNNQNTWDTWLKTFINRTHDFDYQFVVELSDGSGNIDSSLTIRVIHTKPPMYESWFQQSGLQVDANKLYFILLTTEHDSAAWATEYDLGSIDNGGISKKSITTSNASGVPLKLIIEPNSNSRIPQGLKLREDGMILGRTTFRTHIDDPNSLPIDDVYEFTVRATTTGDKSFSTRRFRIKVNRVNETASDNLYIRAFPTVDQRLQLSNILNDPSIFPTSKLFRPTDPWFGVRRDLYIEFAMGVNKTPADQYQNLIQNNHYSKFFYFGDVRTAVILNSAREIEYEIVYVTVIDTKLGRDQDHKLSEAQTALVDLTQTRTYVYTSTPENDLWYYADQPTTEHYFLTENDIYNMRYTIRDNIGYVADAGNLVPEWASSDQPTPDGQYTAPIGFVPIVVLAYVKPGAAEEIRTKLSAINFNFSRFEFDRYQLENWLSDYWDQNTKRFILGVPTEFDNNNTVFDHNSTRLIDNQEQYQSQHEADKYIKFPRTGVFR